MPCWLLCLLNLYWLLFCICIFCTTKNILFFPEIPSLRTQVLSNLAAPAHSKPCSWSLTLIYSNYTFHITYEEGNLKSSSLWSWVHPWIYINGCMCAKSRQWCLTPSDPMDGSLPGSSVHGILQARVLEWVTISFSRRSSRPSDRTQVSCIAGRFFSNWATREAPLHYTAETKPIL